VSGDRLRWLGHATVLVELGGVRVLTDPLLRRRILHLRRAAPLDLAELDEVDAILLSHAHYDHLDPPSLRRLPRSAEVVVPRGAGELVGRQGFETVTEVDQGDEVAVGELRVRAVPAAHESRRMRGSRTEALGYLLEGDDRRIYFPGDTDLFPEMADLAPGLDVALLPIWGWGPSLGVGHLDPTRAAEALVILRPRIAVPIHWGTYYPITSGLLAPPRFLKAPAAEFVQRAAQLAPDVEVRVLRVGGTLELDGAGLEP
jgi:L-ascorbate metabolism protein UlaG (beta-lactamase superfamily)